MSARKIVYTALTTVILAAAAFLTPLPSHGPDNSLPVPPMNITAGYAARWDHCSLSYSVNPANAPRGALVDLDQAIKAVTAATGMKFQRTSDNSIVIQKDTTLSSTGKSGQPDVLVGWAVASDNPRAGEVPVSNLLDGEENPAKTEVFSSWRGRRGFIAPVHKITGAGLVFTADRGHSRGKSGQLSYALHELGHVLGLSHSDDPTSVMYFTGVPERDVLTPEDAALLRTIVPTKCLEAAGLEDEKIAERVSPVNVPNSVPPAGTGKLGTKAEPGDIDRSE